MCYAGLACLVAQSAWLVRDADWVYFWTAGHALISGQNPYHAVDALQADPLYYPGPALLLLAPFGLLSMGAARLLFALLSGLAFGLAAARYGRGLLVGALSASFLEAVTYGQWTPLLMASAIIPGLGFLLVAKPSLGLALFAWNPQRVAVIGGLALTAVSFLVIPSWPLDWWRALAETDHHVAPVMRPLGWLLLLAALRWRIPEARLLLVLALIPQTTTLQGALPLFLIPRTRWEGYGLAILSYVVAGLQVMTVRGISVEAGLASRWPVIFGLLWIPALVMVLRPARFLEGSYGTPTAAA
jgi:hypothetical protein